MLNGVCIGVGIILLVNTGLICMVGTSLCNWLDAKTEKVRLETVH